MLAVGGEELVTREAGLGEDGAQSRRLDDAMVGYGQALRAAGRVASHGDVIAFSNHTKAEVSKARTTRGFGASTGNLRITLRLWFPR